MLITNEQPFLYTIELINEDSTIVKIDLFKNEITVGSNDACDITIKKNNIELQSFKLIKTDNSYKISKTSKDSIILNNRELEDDKELKTDDTISVDNITLKFTITSPNEINTDSLEDDDNAGKTQFMQVLSIDDKIDKGSLVCMSGSLKGQIFLLEKDKMTVGRDASNDICIAKDGLSRAHAIIEVGEKSITIIDFNSTNGTFVKGKKITTEIVQPGSLIQFANAAFKYELAGFQVDEKSPSSNYKMIIIFIITCLCILSIGMFFSIKQKKSIEQQKKKLVDLAEKIKESEEWSPAKSLKIAEEAYESKNYEEALKIIETILEKKSDYAGALLLKGKITKAEKLAEVDAIFNKAMQYYKANEFQKATESFSLIDAEYPKYQEVAKYLKTLENVTAVEEIYKKAIQDFNTGNIEKTLEAVDYMLKQIPEYNLAKELKLKVKQVNSLFSKISETNNLIPAEELENYLLDIMSISLEPDNYYYQYAKKKLKELKTGKNLKAELYYCSGIESYAQKKYDVAYENFKNAYNLTPNILKIKIAMTEVKQKRQKLLLAFYEAAKIISTKNPTKAKFVWKKIIAVGKDDNKYYDEALLKLQD